ncbi:hypothetical protein CR513_34550, partial [Mucuna pruriens]
MNHKRGETTVTNTNTKGEGERSQFFVLRGFFLQLRSVLVSFYPERVSHTHTYTYTKEREHKAKHSVAEGKERNKVKPKKERTEHHSVPGKAGETFFRKVSCLRNPSYCAQHTLLRWHVYVPTMATCDTVIVVLYLWEI